MPELNDKIGSEQRSVNEKPRWLHDIQFTAEKQCNVLINQNKDILFIKSLILLDRMKPCHNHVAVTVMQFKYLIAVIWVNTKHRHMPELGYLIPVTAFPKLFPTIQSDSRLASNTPLGVFSTALMAWLHTMHASLPSWLLPSQTSQKIRNAG